MSSPHHSRSSSNFSNDDIPASDGSKNAISTNAEIRITEGDDSNFYDNLLVSSYYDD